MDFLTFFKIYDFTFFLMTIFNCLSIEKNVYLNLFQEEAGTSWKPMLLARLIVRTGIITVQYITAGG